MQSVAYLEIGKGGTYKNGVQRQSQCGVLGRNPRSTAILGI